jgi:hypothetical protein
MDVDYGAKLMHPSGKPYMEGDTEVTLGQGVFILVNTVPQELKLSLFDSCQLSRIVSEAAQRRRWCLEGQRCAAFTTTT